MSGPDDPRQAAAFSGAERHWRRVEQLFHDVRERPADQRSAFLAQACGDDLALQRDVESLLDQQDGPLLRDGVQMLARQMTAADREGAGSDPTSWGRSSAKAAWARCIGRATRGSIGRSRSSSCR